MASTWYAAGGVPLAFTQKDFLVLCKRNREGLIGSILFNNFAPYNICNYNCKEGTKSVLFH